MVADTSAARKARSARREQDGDRRSTPPDRPSRSAQLDATIHERTRLGIVSALAASERLSFAELKAILKATDGNVSAHARKLEDAGYIASQKRFEGRMPRTEYELTKAGREALERYLGHMEALIRTVRRRQ
jgi:DNA-binding transcriptional ArsR family regulator